MPVVYKRPSSISAVWSRKIGYFVLVLLLTVWVGHRFADLATPNAIAAALFAFAIAGIGLVAALLGFTMLWLIGAKGGRASFVGLCLNLIALAPFGLAAYRYVSLPEQYDVVTSQDRPLEWLQTPQRPASWLPVASSGEIAIDLKNRRIYSELTERRYRGAIDRVYRAVRAVASEEGFEIIAREGDEFLAVDELNERDETSEGEEAAANVPVPAPRPTGRASNLGTNAENNVFEGSTIRLQMQRSSLILGLEHDILILLTEDEAATFVNMRSATKQGPHDLGLNGELINAFLSKVDNRLLGILGAR